MRTGKMFIAAILLCIVPLSMVHAQREAGSFSIGGFGGVGLPMGPDIFKDYFEMGIGFGGELKYNFSEMTCIAASFTFQQFKINDDKVIEDYVQIPPGASIELDGGNAKVNIISANILQYLTPPDASFGFYVKAGGGYYQTGFDDVTWKVTPQGQTGTVKIDESESKMGLNGGAGFEIMLGEKLNLFCEGLYHYVFTEDDKTSFVTVMGGIRITP